MATKGTGWLVRRSTDLVPTLVALAVRELLSGSSELPEYDVIPEHGVIPVPDNS